MPIAPGTYWDLLERNTPPVKRRATHAKARTGCLTCKKRKVKCDEAKPACTRCVKSGHRCAGYLDPTDLQSGSRTASSSNSGGSKHLDGAIPAHPVLRPKPHPVASGAAGSGAERRIANLTRASLTPAYLDVRDALYFERFKCQVLADLGAWCGAEYWRHTILREILVDKTVQHAALGAAAMLMDIEQQQHEHAPWQQPSDKRDSSSSQATMEGEAHTPTPRAAAVDASGKPPPVLPLSNTNPHGKAALRHYTAALGLCRRSLAASGVTAATARSSLTATFFFAVFELVQGNVGEADRLLANGVSLLDDALTRTDPDGSPALVPDSELREIQLAFDRMRVTWGLCPYFGGAAATGDAHVECAGTTAVIGASPGIRHFELPSADASVRTKQVFWNAFSSDFGQFMVSMQGPHHGVAGSRGAGLPALLARRKHYLTQLRHWLPILSDLCAQSPESALLCTTKVYAQTAIIFLNCFLDASDLAYDAYLPVFRDIVATYQRLLPEAEEEAQKHHGGGGGHLRLTLDVDLFHIITFTVSKCRDRETRALALRVFDRMTRRQALWTNPSLLAALRALADLEDRGRDPGGFVPASARYRYVHSEWDFEQRRMIAVFVPALPMAKGSSDISTIRIPIKF
ncbi:hypothetical protein GGS24DRAFT_482738 [Hypoxylon argillaceum]|nr:hypothetical protein GGS24DRAFT_482738 [Hypoxylon argillaceum]